MRTSQLPFFFAAVCVMVVGCSEATEPTEENEPAPAAQQPEAPETEAPATGRPKKTSPTAPAAADDDDDTSLKVTTPPAKEEVPTPRPLGGAFIVDGNTITCKSAQSSNQAGRAVFTLGGCTGDATISYFTLTGPVFSSKDAKCSKALGYGIGVVDKSNEAVFSSACGITVDNPLNGGPVAVTVTNATFTETSRKSLSATFNAPMPK